MIKDYSEPYRAELDRLNQAADSEILAAFACGVMLSLWTALAFLHLSAV